MALSGNKSVKISKDKLIENLFVYALLFLPLVKLAVFYVYVNLNSFILPFIDQDTGLLTTRYFEFFLRDLKLGADSEILLNLKNTLIYFGESIVKLPVILIISYFLYKKIAGYRFFRVIFTVPLIIPTVVFIAIYKNLLSAEGPIDSLVKVFTGHGMVNYPLYTPGLATWAIVLYVFWSGFGMNLIIYSGAMSRIPEDIIEYAKLDGCGFSREMWQIVFPIIFPSISVTILMSVIGIFSVSGPVLLFSGGMYSTSTLAYWMYDKVVLRGQYNYAAAFGFLQTIFTLPLVFVFRWLAGKIETVTF